MSPKKTTALRLDTALLAAMRQVKEIDGVPMTTQIEMALREWLTKRGVQIDPPKRGARSPRKA